MAGHRAHRRAPKRPLRVSLMKCLAAELRRKVRSTRTINQLEMLCFLRPNLIQRRLVNLRRKRFRDPNSALRQSLRFGRLQQTPLKTWDKSGAQVASLRVGNGKPAEGVDSPSNSLISTGESPTTSAHSFAFGRIRAPTLIANSTEMASETRLAAALLKSCEQLST